MFFSPRGRAVALDRNKKYLKIFQKPLRRKGKAGCYIENDDHRVAIIRHGNDLLELDGLKSGPKYHRSTTAETFVQDVALVVQELTGAKPDGRGLGAKGIYVLQAFVAAESELAGLPRT